MMRSIGTFSLSYKSLGRPICTCPRQKGGPWKHCRDILVGGQSRETGEVGERLRGRRPKLRSLW